ncbi:MAG: SEC-C metal-binding domain-containing protein [Bacillota bacterium]
MLIDFESNFQKYLQERFYSGAVRAEESAGPLYREWMEKPNPLLDGQSPNEYWDKHSDVGELLDFLVRYAAAEPIIVPTILRDRIIEAGTDAVPGLIDLASKGNWQQKEAESRERLAPLQASALLSEIRDPRGVPVLLTILSKLDLSDPAADFMIKAVKNFGELARQPVIDALGQPGSEDFRAGLAEVLVSLSPGEDLYETLTALFLQGGDYKGFYGHLLGHYGDPRTLPLLKEAIGDKDLSIVDYDEYRDAFRHLGETPPEREDLELQRLESNDVNQLARWGEEFLHTHQDFNKAEALYRRVLELAPYHWLGYAQLAHTNHHRGDDDAAQQLITTALEKFAAAWAERPEDINYEDYEALEKDAGEIFGDVQERTRQRWLKYARGVMYFNGVLEIEKLIETINMASRSAWNVQSREALRWLREDNYFRKEEYGRVVFRGVILTERILGERRDGLEPKPWNLGALALAAEGRAYKLWSPQETTLMHHFNLLVGGENENIQENGLKIQELIRNAGHPSHVTRLMMDEGIINDEDDAKKMVEAIYGLWNFTPRWELLGWSPSEIMNILKGMGGSGDAGVESSTMQAEKLPLEPPAPESLRLVTGRNDLCPCGSGKKYKKCCGQDTL